MALILSMRLRKFNEKSVKSKENLSEGKVPQYNITLAKECHDFMVFRIFVFVSLRSAEGGEAISI